MKFTESRVTALDDEGRLYIDMLTLVQTLRMRFKEIVDQNSEELANDNARYYMLGVADVSDMLFETFLTTKLETEMELS